MTHDEISGLIFLAGYGVALVLAVRAFGMRRVLWFFLTIVVVGVAIAFRSLGAITDRRS